MGSGGGGEGEVTLESLTVAWRQEDQALLSPVRQGLGQRREMLHPGALTKELKEETPGRLSEVCLAPVPTPPRVAAPGLQGSAAETGAHPASALDGFVPLPSHLPASTLERSVCGIYSHSFRCRVWRQRWESAFKGHLQGAMNF